MGYGIFALTMLCVYMRPFKLPIWVFSTLGALCVFVFGVVSLADIMLVWEITKPSTFALIGLILLSLAFEKLGFLRTLLRVSRHAHILYALGNFLFYLLFWVVL
ncbi:ArsB/NhaD family transporter [uncultured Helicobacter sp.]|uniref:ArsB/NhaD family transporter n=1 Tax=uncultured Helicobacter sp. TaxID=175537 RepID=UPI00374FBF0F